MEPRLILINLLVKLGVAAAVSSSLVRSKEFKSLLFREERTFRQKVYLVLWFGLPIMIGVWIRTSQKSFLAGDLSFETALLLGVIGGRWSGSLGGVLMGIPALLHHEWAAMPFDVLAGFLAGQLRTMAIDKDDIWSFSPFIDQSIFRIMKRNLPRPRLFDWQIMFFWTVIALRFVQTELARYFPGSTFSAWRVRITIGYIKRHLRRVGYGDRNRAENIQQRAHPDQTGRTGTPPAACAHGGAAEPDQSAFFVQYVELSSHPWCASIRIWLGT